ncbi:cytochrome P450 4V2-like [Ixodes scapularis]|uniref:cytochrome P450 4V2-like n=1 Tax=Ixodes scapularis TaxID=6945 RepID=UPI001A9FECEB|nr:cytochrome P450 4V2-like [Ixodes scapularis]
MDPQVTSNLNWPLVKLLAPWILGSIVCVYVTAPVLDWFRMWKTLRPMPGPWNLPPFGFLFVLIKDSFKKEVEHKEATAKIFSLICDTCKKYTDKTFKVYIGLTPVVVIHTPDAAETLLTSNTNQKRPFMYNFIDSWVGQFNILVSTDEVWRFKRKLMTPAFHFRVLKNYMRIFNEHGDGLLKNICAAIDKAPEDPVRLFETTQKCAMDIIGEVTTGEKLGLQENKNLSFMESFNRAMFLLSTRSFSPWFWNQTIYDNSSDGKHYNGDIREMMEFTHSIMQQNSKLSDERIISKCLPHHNELDFSVKNNTLMDLLMKKHREDKRYTLSDVRMDIDSIIGAGNDSTTTAMCWTLNLLGHNTDAQAKVHEELDEIFGSNNDGEISADDLRRMKYLECCLKEALRLYPSFCVIGRLLDEDLIMDGHRVPKGVTCFVNIYSLHRNPKYFKDPEQFLPERFLSDENKSRHRFSYIPFSGGPKNCIGQKFAMIEMKLILAKVLRKCEVKSKIPLDRLKVAYEVIIKDKGGNKIWIRRRTAFCSTLQ